MNGNGLRFPDRPAADPRYGSGPGPPLPPPQAPPQAQPPSTRVLLDGYKGMASSPYEERARYNPLNKSRPRSSALLNVNDPVAMHLLVETALGDGQEYEVLSFEEVDEMKKEHSLLSNRIDASRRKLALESKVRDAAYSLGRLGKKGRQDSDGSPKQRRSFLGNRRSDPFDKADDEVAASNRKCDELAQELWKLEKRANDIQRRLLQHTAGILQMTHRGIIKGGPGAPNGVQTPRHDSGGGLYPYANGGIGLPDLEEEDGFGKRSLYRSLDNLDDLSGARRSRGSNPELAQQLDSAEKKLEALNGRVREMIVQVNPQLGSSHQSPPQLQANGVPPRPGASIQPQLEYLEKSLDIIDRQQSTMSRGLQQSESAVEERLEGMNRQLRDVINQADPQRPQGHPPPPQSSGQSLQDQLGYLEDALDVVEQSMHGSARAGDGQERVEQFETVLTGLWQIILSGEEEARQRKRQRRQARSDEAEDDDSDVSPDEEVAPNEHFSLPAFSAKVQWLYARATALREQKDILRRQVKQQRQLNRQGDGAKDAQVAELTRARDASEKEAVNARQEATLVMQRLDAARREWAAKEQQRDSGDSAAMRGLQQSQEELRKVQAALEQTKREHDVARAELQGEIGEHGLKMQSLEVELRAAVQARDAALANEGKLRQQVEAKAGQVQKVRSEMEALEGEVVRLQTEVTVARAELDGAYGTRAQRAAEVATNPAIQKELDELGERNAMLLAEMEALKAAGAGAAGGPELQRRVQTLQQELSETITDYEAMTKQIIEMEKERESLESTVDGLRDRCEGLETELSDERVRWMGMKSPTSAGQGGEGPSQTTSTTVLKNEFKKMMRDTRAENVRQLRAEQEERRRLEAVVRTLRKEQAPGKSGLSHSVSAS
ncbi:MAG: hypothetical protein M1832_005139 [Thelocarpon impressellum]|nr:MAG: hypothetical protein M1832_005139 [Thelocarpon impressellum]